MRPFCSLASLLLLSTFFASAQSAPITPVTTGLELLQRVSQHYTDAKSYFVEQTELDVTDRKYDHESRTTIRTAAEAPGGRYYYEGLSAFGNSLSLSDGKQAWDYRLDEHRYTVRTLPDQAAKSAVIEMSEQARMEAERMREELAQPAKHLKSAERLPDDTLTKNGKTFSCYLVRVRTFDEKQP